MIGQLVEYALQGLRHWWSHVTCRHDYVIVLKVMYTISSQHYDEGKGISLERCTKCGKINRLGR